MATDRYDLTVSAFRQGVAAMSAILAMSGHRTKDPGAPAADPLLRRTQCVPVGNLDHPGTP